MVNKSFSDTESGEDQIKNVIVCGGAGDFVQRTQRTIKIQQKHFMWNFILYGEFGAVQARQ